MHETWYHHTTFECTPLETKNTITYSKLIYSKTTSTAVFPGQCFEECEDRNTLLLINEYMERQQ